MSWGDKVKRPLRKLTVLGPRDPVEWTWLGLNYFGLRMLLAWLDSWHEHWWDGLPVLGVYLVGMVAWRSVRLSSRRRRGPAPR